MFWGLIHSVICIVVMDFFLISNLVFFSNRTFEFNRTQNLVFPGGKCIVQHIRHGDAKVDYRENQFNITKHSSLQSYVNFSKPFLQELETKNIFLMTDDGLVLEETKKYPEYNWVYMKKPMHKGWADEAHHQHFPSGDAVLETAIILLTWETAARCQTIVGAISEVCFTNQL
jgi:hypothetical protein